MNKKRNYQVLSPDGFTIDFHKPTYPSLKAAKAALENWVQIYKHQGFYSSPSYGRIPFNDIMLYCEIV